MVIPKPNFNSDFNLVVKIQISIAFRDARQTAVAAYEAATSDNEIYLNYFPASVSWMLNDPAEIVQDVFKPIFASQLNGCGKTLENVVISKDYDVPGYGYSCNDPSDAGEIIDYDTANPNIILCDSALQHSYVDEVLMIQGLLPPVTCDTIGDRTSWRMARLGSTLLHEWMHIERLVGAALASLQRLAEGIDIELDDDDVYRCVDTQTVANDEHALYLANNYAWFATEAFWSKKCGRRFSNPGSADDQDPLFGGQPGAEAQRRTRFLDFFLGRTMYWSTIEQPCDADVLCSATA